MMSAEEWIEIAHDIAAVANEGIAGEMTMGEEWVERRGIPHEFVYGLAKQMENFIRNDPERVFDLFVKTFALGLECGRRTQEMAS